MARDEFVLDCSVALSWCFLDEQDEYAVAVLNSLTKSTAIVPAIWPSEVTNGLLMAERRKRSSEADTTQWISSFAALPIEVDSRAAPDYFLSVVPLARAHGLTSYDASYLEVAMRRNLPFSTMDERLRSAATAVGVKLYEPRANSKRKK